MLVGLQRRLIYFPFPAQVPGAEALVAGAREVTLRTVDGLALGAWLVGPASWTVGWRCWWQPGESCSSLWPLRSVGVPLTTKKISSRP